MHTSWSVKIKSPSRAPSVRVCRMLDIPDLPGPIKIQQAYSLRSIITHHHVRVTEITVHVAFKVQCDEVSLGFVDR
jgi:hypothetical protein